MLDSMSRAEETRTRILATTRELLERADGRPLSMGAIADAVGVTRQLLYLHFANRAQLLLEVSREADAAARTPDRQARIDSAPDAASALREAVTLQGHIKPKIHAVARAVDRLRVTDPDAEAVWREREEQRLARCRSVVRRLADEGLLRQGWTVATASQMLWSVTSLRAWEELVVESGWTTRAWVRHTTNLVERAFVAS